MGVVAVKITERWTVVREPHGLRLDERYDGRDKDGKPIERVRSTWHATLEQCARRVLDAELSERERADAQTFHECTMVALKAIDGFVSER